MKWFTDLPLFDIFYISLIALSLLITFWKRSNYDKGLNYLPVLCGVYLLLELSSAYAASFLDNTHFLYHLFSPIEYTVYCIIFFSALRQIKWRKLILYSIPVFWITSASISIWDGLRHTTSKLFLIRSCIMLFFCLTYFKKILTKDISPNSSDMRQMFWFCVAVTFYFAGKIFIAGLMDILIENNIQQARNIYYTGYIFNYILFFTILVISFTPKVLGNDQEL